jgi:hypothetical protein
MEQIGSEYNFKTGGAIKELNDAIARVDALEKAQDKLGKTTKQTGETVSNTGKKIQSTTKNFDVLGNSINQVTRELPAFAFSAQTGFLAISNNIPILVDSINQLKVANAALAAEGKATIPVFKQIISSLISWQTVLSLLISFTVMYGKEIGAFISSIFKSKDAMDVASLSIQNYNKSLKDTKYKDAIDDINQLRVNLMLYKDGLLTQKQVVDEFNESLGKSTKEIKSVAEAEQFLIDKGPAFIKMSFLKAAALNAQSDASKAYVEQQQVLLQREQVLADNRVSIEREVQNQLANINRGSFKGRKLTQEEYAKEEIRIRNLVETRYTKDFDKQIVDFEKQSKNLLKISDNLFKQAAKVAKDSNISLFDEDEEKKKALSAFQQLQKDIADTEDAINSANVSGLDTTALEAKFKTLTAQLEKVKAAFDEITGEAAKKRAKEFQETYEAALKDVEDAAQEAGRIGDLDLKKRRKEDKEAEKKALDEKKENLQEELNANTEFFINKREEREYSKKELTLLDIAELESRIEILKTSKDASVENEKEILSIQKVIGRLKIKANKESNDEILDDDKERAKVQKALLQELAQFGFSVSSGYFELRKAQLRDETDIQLEELNKQKDAKIISDEEYNNKKKAIINQENQKQRELDLAQIKVQTALAVIRAFATAPNPIIGAFLAALAATEGAIQYSFAASQPLPRFAKGTDRVIGGTKGQDSVHALLMPDEAVIPAKENLARPNLAKAWINGNLDSHLMMNYIKPAIQENNKKWEAMFKVNQNSTFIRNDNFNDKRIVNKLDRIGRVLDSKNKVVTRKNSRLWNLG